MAASWTLLLVLAAVVCSSGAPAAAQAPDATAAPAAPNQTFQGEVAFAAPPVNVTAANTTSCDNFCWVVKDYYPFKTCKPECNAQTCSRGFGAWKSQELCCAPGLAFPDGCTSRPAQCWVPENPSLRTCVRDDRKCLAGSGVYGSWELCCTPSAAYQAGCGNVTLSPTPCWVVDSYFPVRTCRQSRTLCDPKQSNVQVWSSQAACCGPSGAFGTQGCSNSTPPTPCWVVDNYYPDRTCRQETDAAACYRGWGVFQSESICCAQGAGFPEGCSKTTTTTPAAGAAGGLPGTAGRRMLA